MTATGGGRKGLRWCGFALFLVRFCGNFYFNSRYYGFKTLSGLRLLQPVSRGFRWKKGSAVITLFRTVGIWLFCKREPSVLFYNASGFIISAYNLTLWFCNYGLFQLILNVINRFGHRQPTDQIPEKWYPVLDPNALIYIPYPRVNGLKTMPFTVTQIYIAHIWQYPFPPPGGSRLVVCWVGALFLLVVSWLAFGSMV